MQVVETALDQFEKAHGGAKPNEIVITRHAMLALASGHDFKIASLRGIPIRVEDLNVDDVADPGQGTRLGIFVKDNGIQLHIAAVDLR